MEPQSGKSVVALGLMELLSARVERLGFFRPDRAGSATRPTRRSSSIRRRYQLGAPHEEMYALIAGRGGAIGDLRGAAEARRRGVQGAGAAAAISSLCEGTDFTGAAPALDFGLNADLANELGAPVLVVVKAGSPDGDASRRSAPPATRSQHKGCTIFGVVVNRVAADAHGRDPAPRSRRRTAASRSTSSPSCRSSPAPTVAEMAAALGRRDHVRPRRRGPPARGARRPGRGDERGALHRRSRRRHARDRSRRPAGHPRRQPRLDGLARRSRPSPASSLTGGYPLERERPRGCSRARRSRCSRSPQPHARRGGGGAVGAAAASARRTSARSRTALGRVRSGRRHGRARAADRARAAVPA